MTRRPSSVSSRSEGQSAFTSRLRILVREQIARVPPLPRFFFRKSLPKERIGLNFGSDGRNYGAGREKIGHFIPPRLAQSNGSQKLP
jgi:hypothetical protein